MARRSLEPRRRERIHEGAIAGGERRHWRRVGRCASGPSRGRVPPRPAAPGRDGGGKLAAVRGRAARRRRGVHGSPAERRGLAPPGAGRRAGAERPGRLGAVGAHGETVGGGGQRRRQAGDRSIDAGRAGGPYHSRDQHRPRAAGPGRIRPVPLPGVHPAGGQRAVGRAGPALRSIGKIGGDGGGARVGAVPDGAVRLRADPR